MTLNWLILNTRYNHLQCNVVAVLGAQEKETIFCRLEREDVDWIDAIDLTARFRLGPLGVFVVCGLELIDRTCRPTGQMHQSILIAD